MERGLIVSEYFRLRDYLNRANKFSNQITEIGFEIEEVQLLQYKFFAVSYGPNESHKIALAERAADKIWERTGNTRFSKLEEFCAENLNQIERVKGPQIKSRKISEPLKILMAREISAHLKMLLLNKGYEP
jgi:hypothetical protein